MPDPDRVVDRTVLAGPVASRRRGRAARPTGCRTRSRSRPAARRARSRARALPSSAFMRATEFVPMSTSAPPSSDDSNGIAIATSARTSTRRRRRPSIDAWRRRAAAVRGANGCSRSTGSTPSGTTRTTDDRVRDALERQRAAILVPDAVDRAREVRHLADARISPARACPHRRAARFSAPPRYPPSTCDGLAGVEPDADREGQLRLLERLLDEPLLEVDGGRGSPRAATRRRRAPRRLAARGACRRAPRRPLATMSANFAASFAAASSPRSCVNSV